MKKQRKSKASLRKKKRQRAKNKRLREKGIIVPENNTDTEEVVSKPDSLKYKFAALKEDRYIIITFNKKDPVKTDSIFVRYNSDEDDVLDYDKQVIKTYIDSNKIENIKLINVREHIGDHNEDERHNKHASTVKEHVAQYLVKLGVLRERIKTISK